MTTKINPFMSTDPRGTIWTPARIDRELSLLASTEILTDHKHHLHEGRLQIVGRIRSRQIETGKLHSMVVRLDYPRRYPREAPRVFDHERQFRPSAKGHQFMDYSLCLSFPLRGEFAIGSEALSREVLGSSLIWFDKRLIFDRTDRWPGEAEEHGWARPLAKLILEEARRSDRATLEPWAIWIVDGVATLNYNGGCPCCSGRNFRQCHSRLAALVDLYLFAKREEEKLNEQRSTLEAA
jgi:hypothetical protein